MRSPSGRAWLLGATLAALAAAPARAQDQTIMRALDLEQAGKAAEAAVVYRSALSSPNTVAAMLGLERVYTELGWTDSLVPVVDSVLRFVPRNPVLRTVQLRVLRATGRDAAVRGAFERWVREVPNDAAPYREYARLLMQDGRAAAADTVLRRAQETFGGGREFATEVAQLRASMGMWAPAARSWRDALIESPYLVQAAVYSLSPAPKDARDAVRQALLAPPASTGARRILAALETQWGSAREGWSALSALPASDSAATAWSEFGALAESAEAWLVARDAFAAVHAFRRAPEVAVRAAGNALSGNDAESALRLTQEAAALLDSSTTARVVLPLQVRALTALGRAPAAEALVASYAASLDPQSREELARSIAWGWVRAGDVARARAALAGSAAADVDEEITGWLAFYDGDLKTARTALRRAARTTPDQVTALAILARTRAERSTTLGQALLTLARGDSVRAAARLTEAATELPDAGPILLATAGRLHAAHKDDSLAVNVWQTILSRYPNAPEAAEADLEWARALRRRGANVDAVARLEHLILTYPQSALVPQARRELELARNGVPGAT